MLVSADLREITNYSTKYYKPIFELNLLNFKLKDLCYPLL